MSEKPSFLKTQLWSIITIVIIMVMGIEILLLVQENKKLRALLSRPQGALKILKPEEKVPSLIGTNLNDQEVKIEYPSAQKTVLFWFSPACPSCEENLEFWKSIYQKYSSENLRFFAVARSGKVETEKFMQKYQLEFPALTISDQSLLDQYRVEVIPQTMLIDTDGAVQKVWPGPLPENYRKEIEEMLSSSSKPQERR